MMFQTKTRNTHKNADEYKTLFPENVTHEFKTRLILILEPVSSIINGQCGEINEAARKQLEIAQQYGLATLSLINQVLELTKTDAGQAGSDNGEAAPLVTSRLLFSDDIEGSLSSADECISKPFSRDLHLSHERSLLKSMNKLRGHFKSGFSMESEHSSVGSNIDKFLSKALAILEKNISNSDYDVEQFSKDIGISQVQLYRKLTRLVGQSPAEFMRTIRLKRAARILEDSIVKDINVSEISFSLGFANHSHFSQLFKKHYGCTPSDYAKKSYNNSSVFSETTEL